MAALAGEQHQHGSTAVITDASPSPEILLQQAGVNREAAGTGDAKKTDAIALNGSRKQKSKQAGKKNAMANSGDKAGAKLAKDRQSLSKQAILAGNTEGIKRLCREGPEWLDGEILGVLDAVINEVELIDTPTLDALDAFFTAIKETRQAAGIALLTNYFVLHGHVFAGLKSLADRHGLIPAKHLAAVTAHLALNEVNRMKATGKVSRHSWEIKSEKIVFLEHTGEAHGNDGPLVQQRKIKFDKTFSESTGSVIATTFDGLSNCQEFVSDVAQSMTYAAQEGNIDEVRGMLKLVSPAEPSAEGWTPLMQAVRHGHMHIVQLLLKSGTLPEQLAARDSLGENALMWAAKVGSEQAVKLLISAGAKSSQLTEVDNEGWNALFHAAQKGSAGIVRQLLDADHQGKQISLNTSNGANAMMIAAAHGNDAVISVLLTMPSGEAQLIHADRLRCNAMFMAVSGGQVKVVKLLLTTRTAREQAMAEHLSGSNALTHAAELGHTALVRLFLDTEFADDLANSVTAFHSNPLMYAAQNGHAEIVQLLLGMKSGDRQRKNVSSDGRNALTLAAGKGHEDIVRLLLSGPDAPDRAVAEDERGMNAIDYARVINHLAIVKLLEDVALHASPKAAAANSAAPEKAAD